MKSGELIFCHFSNTILTHIQLKYQKSDMVFESGVLKLFEIHIFKSLHEKLRILKKTVGILFIRY